MFQGVCKGAVVEVKLALAVPTVSVVVVMVLTEPALVWRTQTLWPLLIVPAVFVNEPLQPIEYSLDAAPETLIAVAVLTPEIVTALEVRALLSGTSVCAVKLNESGVVSQASVVTLKLYGVALIVTVFSTRIPRPYGTLTCSP